MKRAIFAVIGVAMCSMLFATAGFSSQDEKADEKDQYYKGYSKDEHMHAFPQGHPAVDTQNNCIWDQESALYFCQYDRVQTRPGGGR